MEKPLPQPPRIPDLNVDMDRWLRLLPDLIPRIIIYSPVLNPASISSSTISRQSFTINGIKAADVIFVNPPALTLGLDLISARTTGANSVQFVYYNSTGSLINEGSATYNVVAIRN